MSKLLFGLPFLCAMALLVLNDYWLKPLGIWPLVHGKLSNVAGLFAMPVLLYIPLQALFPKSSVRRLSLISIFAVGFVFSLWETSTTFHQLYGKMIQESLRFFSISWHYKSVQDISDLLCLPTLAVAHVYILKRQQLEDPTY